MSRAAHHGFADVRNSAAPLSVRNLETKARTASRLAKIHPEHASTFYSIKHAALRQLFRIANYAPIVSDAGFSARGYLVTVQLRITRSFLHIPFEELWITTQQTYGAWVAQRASNRPRYRAQHHGATT